GTHTGPRGAFLSMSAVGGRPHWPRCHPWEHGQGIASASPSRTARRSVRPVSLSVPARPGPLPPDRGAWTRTSGTSRRGDYDGGMSRRPRSLVQRVRDHLGFSVIAIGVLFILLRLVGVRSTFAGFVLSVAIT